jgi:hypothetical protein
MQMTAEENIAELQQHGFCVLRGHFSHRLIDDCRQAFLPVLTQHLRANAGKPNRGPHRYAPDTHRMPRSEALRAVECRQIPMLPVTLNIGLIRHPWALM